jgi:hypothetical protein
VAEAVERNGIVVLENERARAEIVPAQGGRVRSLRDRRSGRELLYRRPGEAWERDDYLATLAGGWDQMFPNDDPWLDWPVHGTLWAAEFELAEAATGAARLHCRLTTPAVEVEHRYELLGPARAGLRLETTVRAHEALGSFLWATHPMLAVETDWRIDAGEGTLEADRVDPGRVAAGPLDAEARERILRLPTPRQGWQEIVYGDATGEASVGSGDGRAQTRVRWDASFFRHLWIVTLSGFESVDLGLVLEPCTTRPYRLDEVEPGQETTLEAGAARSFWSEVESLDQL